MTFLGYWHGKERWRGTGFDPAPGGMTTMAPGSMERYNYVKVQHSLGRRVSMMVNIPPSYWDNRSIYD